MRETSAPVDLRRPREPGNSVSASSSARRREVSVRHLLAKLQSARGHAVALA